MSIKTNNQQQKELAFNSLVNFITTAIIFLNDPCLYKRQRIIKFTFRTCTYFAEVITDFKCKHGGHYNVTLAVIQFSELHVFFELVFAATLLWL